MKHPFQFVKLISMYDSSTQKSAFRLITTHDVLKAQLQLMLQLIYARCTLYVF